jgi:hypothetical protein
MGKQGYYAVCKYCKATFHSKTRQGLHPYTSEHGRREHPIEYGMLRMASTTQGSIAETSPQRMFDFFP